MTTPPTRHSPEHPAPSPPPERPWRILIVDDNPDIITVIRRILTSRGYETASASNGIEALREAREGKPDLILLDWMLPEKDGLQVCRELKADPATRGIMVLLVTGRGSVQNRVEGFNAGADDYIPKPFNHPELLARIGSALRLKKLADDLEERNRQLVESQQELVRAEKMATIGLLASGIAHEFNNIMAGISGYAQLARKNPRFAPQLIEVALTQTERALELTRSLSTYHRTEDQEASCDVTAVVKSTLWLVKKKLEQKGIGLETALDPVPAASLSPGQLQEIVLNLLINAIHAVAQGGRIRLGASTSPGRSEVIITVEDDGVGISSENLTRVFDPFFTTKGALGGGKQAGTGLGLSVCYNIVQARGGKIDVESRPQEGTKFTVVIPSRQGVAASREDLASASRGGATPASATEVARRRILVVDDEPFVREMLCQHLSGHDVTCCESGESAVATYESDPHDLVVLDICMRDSMDGLETFRRLLQIDPEARVVLASGRLPEEVDSEVLSRTYGHLLKPYHLEELDALIAALPPSDRAAAANAL